jgi:hypothetical protein
MTPESASIATLAIFIIALLLHLLIMIWVISAGVKSGIKSADWWNQHHLMVNNRLLITLLVNNFSVITRIFYIGSWLILPIYSFLKFTSYEPVHSTTASG